jgi:hypothetical protein
VAPEDPKPVPPFGISPGGIIVTSLKPASGGRACLVRLFNAGGSPDVATFSFGTRRISAYRSSLHEERGEKLSEISLPANGIATVLIGE